MLSNESINLFEEISSVHGVAGNERLVSEMLRKYYEELSDDIIYDNLGSIYAVKKSKNVNAKRVMVSGHMDEIGFIINKFYDNGLIGALMLGNIPKNSLLGASVEAFNEKRHVFPGTILSIREDETVLDEKNNLIIDLGFMDKNQSETNLQIGDTISFSSEFIRTSSGTIMCRNINGRYAPVIGIELLRALDNIELPFDLYVGCTVQEQVGLRGIQTATNKVSPDLAIILESNKSFDYQLNSEDKIGILGGGLLLTYYAKTVLPNRLLISELKKLCDNNEIKYQYYYSLEDSEAGWVNKLRTGCPSLFINIPVRNFNTPKSVISEEDFGSAREALIKFIEQLDNNKIELFKSENR
ncbi:M42 family peptidase [Companilactobacillus allii]|uniref:Peptidase M42 n=1 Tax=Companilactobacillus allii TaxID=1847728 RepID=A0A1P8Q536_9LACO|nr:hypothetical protein [Companilactobacillus allii]APX72977.1 hypothetical protein BTM29_10620 [Companilactobacillus allii]USQ67771.1 M42 family peptidase [Companilactobacillus allii]